MKYVLIVIATRIAAAAEISTKVVVENPVQDLNSCKLTRVFVEFSREQ
jgi:hypothetical protein